MSLSARERNRASRIRRALREGRATSQDRAWLDTYERRRAPRVKRAVTAQRPALRVPVADTSPEPVTGADTPHLVPEGDVARVLLAGDTLEALDAPPVSEPQPPAPSPGLATDYTTASAPPLVDAEPVETAAPSQAPDRCDDPDCVSCRCPPSRTCAVTGRPVHPRPNPEAARVWAVFLLGAIGTAIRARTGKDPSPITDTEVDKVAMAIAEVQWRRAGWSTQWDDLLALVGTTGAYTIKRIKETAG